MKSRMLMMAVVLLAASSAMAQNANGTRERRERQQNFDITEVYNRQATRLVKQLKLEGEQKDLFTVLYLDYQNARHNAANPKGGDQEGEELRVDFKNLTDEKATELIEKNFERQEKQLAVDKEYLPKFLEFLTPVQAAQVFIRVGGGRQGDNAGGRPGGFGGGRPGGFGGCFGGGRPGGF